MRHLWPPAGVFPVTRAGRSALARKAGEVEIDDRLGRSRSGEGLRAAVVL